MDVFELAGFSAEVSRELNNFLYCKYKEASRNTDLARVKLKNKIRSLDRSEKHELLRLPRCGSFDLEAMNGRFDLNWENVDLLPDMVVPWVLRVLNCADILRRHFDISAIPCDRIPALVSLMGIEPYRENHLQVLRRCAEGAAGDLSDLMNV